MLFIFKLHFVSVIKIKFTIILNLVQNVIMFNLTCRIHGIPTILHINIASKIYVKRYIFCKKYWKLLIILYLLKILTFYQNNFHFSHVILIMSSINFLFVSFTDLRRQCNLKKIICSSNLEKFWYNSWISLFSTHLCLINVFR